MSLIPKKGTVYVVDDDEAVRDSLQWLLEGKDYRVKCFDSAESFLSRFDPREVACLIADIRMDGMSGLELQDRLLERRSPLPVVFITGHGDVPMAVTTMKKGAMDFIEKPFKEEELVSLVERMLDQARVAFSQHQEQASRDALLSRLTTREAQVLERIVAGRLNKQIADDLGISIKTVEAHRALGGNTDIDVPYQYLMFFMEDDARLAEIKQAYSTGAMLSGEIKQILIEELTTLVQGHQERRAQVTDDVVREFMRIRPMGGKRA